MAIYRVNPVSFIVKAGINVRKGKVTNILGLTRYIYTYMYIYICMYIDR